MAFTVGQNVGITIMTEAGADGSYQVRLDSGEVFDLVPRQWRQEHTHAEEAVQAEEDDATDEVSSDTAAEAALQATAENAAQLEALLAVILVRLDHIETRLEREFHDIFRRLMELEGVP